VNNEREPEAAGKFLQQQQKECVFEMCGANGMLFVWAKKAEVRQIARKETI